MVIRELDLSPPFAFQILNFWALVAKAILSLGLAAPESSQFSYGLSG